MKGRERAFLAAVALFAALLAARAITDAARTLSAGAELDAMPSAGEPREVDVPTFRRLLDAGVLSDREALHYRRVSEPK